MWEEHGFNLQMVGRMISNFVFFVGGVANAGNRNDVFSHGTISLTVTSLSFCWGKLIKHLLRVYILL